MNSLIIGAGHYATGENSLTGLKETDKDFGVILPSLLALQHYKLIDNIGIVARSKPKVQIAIAKFGVLAETYGWNPDITVFGTENDSEESDYIKALDSMEKPFNVFVVTPNRTHFEILKECLKRGIDCFVVKPAVSSLADLNELISLQKQYRGKCFVDYHKLFDPANLMLRQEMKNCLEDLYQISSVMTQRSDMKEIFKNEIKLDPSFNANWYIGCHYIQLVASITKAKPIDVRSIGFGEISKENSSNYDLIETSITWRTQSGHTFSSNHLAGWGDPSNAPSMSTQKINVITKNSRIYSNQDYRGVEVQKEGKDLSRPNPFFFRLPQVDEGLSGWESNYGFRSIRSFLDFSKGVSFKEGWIPTLEDSIIVTRILEAADSSLKSGSKVIEL